MKTFAAVLTIFLIGTAVIIPEASAGPAADKLAACLADSTTGKDRKEMARWVFATMSVHPDIHNLSNVSPKQKDDLDKAMGGLVTRLLTESCKDEAALAIDSEGESSFNIAFRQMGVLAMKELMSNSEVKSSIQDYAKYLDKNKFEHAFAKK